MKYELAKELKEAGFPQIIKDTQYTGALECGHCGYFMKGEVHIPTLSELIEACGKYIELSNGDVRFKDWYASAGKAGEEIEGKTPEEAVARLYIALNKK